MADSRAGSAANFAVDLLLPFTKRRQHSRKDIGLQRRGRSQMPEANAIVKPSVLR